LYTFSCKEDIKSQDSDYQLFSFSNTDWKSKKITYILEEISYTAIEVPLQYYILKNGIQETKAVDSVYGTLNKERVLEIEFEHSERKDLLLKDFTQRSYDDAVKYMSFFIEKDFEVITSSGDTIQCSGVNFERNFKVAPFKRLLLYFNNINPDETIKLVYKDNLFGNGIMEFNFQEIPLKL